MSDSRRDLGPLYVCRLYWLDAHGVQCELRAPSFERTVRAVELRGYSFPSTPPLAQGIGYAERLMAEGAVSRIASFDQFGGADRPTWGFSAISREGRLLEFGMPDTKKPTWLGGRVPWPLKVEVDEASGAATVSWPGMDL